jgi:hypothetical protein
MATARASALAARLDALRRGGRSSVPYQEPSGVEMQTYGAWVRGAAQAARDGAAPPTGGPAGFALEVIEGQWLLREDGAPRGAGAVVLPPNAPAGAPIVEAPHTFHDVGTLPIALEAFAEGPAAALLVNTVHRAASRPGGPDGAGGGENDTAELSSDLAHAPRSFFLAAHEVLLDVRPDALVIQLHGFADGTATGAAVVLSAAGTRADPAPAARALRSELGDGVVDIAPARHPQLGGLTNVEALACRRRAARFLHVELSRSLRDRLLRDAPARAAFVRRLLASAP